MEHLLKRPNITKEIAKKGWPGLSGKKGTMTSNSNWRRPTKGRRPMLLRPRVRWEDYEKSDIMVVDPRFAVEVVENRDEKILKTK